MPAKVLVIGGGFAGTKLSIVLASYGHEVTLVSRCDFFEVAFANARSVVEPATTDLSLMLYQDMKPRGKFVQGTVVELTDSSALLADGTTLDFDYAAICTGSDYQIGKGGDNTLTLQQRKEEVEALSKRVKAAGDIVIVGGGATGVELAGEIVQDYPDKQVTLVHSGERLLPNLPAKLGDAAAKWLQERKCKVILNDKLLLPATGAPSGSFTGETTAGVSISGDLLLMATGIRVNTSFMRTQLADALDGTGRVKVDKHLRVIGHPKLFALGDVTNVDEGKLAFLAAKHGELVAKNLHILMQAHDKGEAAVAAAEKKLAVWKPSLGFPVTMVSIGRKFGVARIGPISLVGFIPTQIKSKCMTPFIQLYRKQLLAKP